MHVSLITTDIALIIEKIDVRKYLIQFLYPYYCYEFALRINSTEKLVQYFIGFASFSIRCVNEEKIYIKDVRRS
jgi:hypothetical protein